MTPDSTDARLMRRCFELARAAVGRRELPFGSVVARDGIEISGEGNGVRQARDVTRHAEVCAIVSAQQRIRPWPRQQWRNRGTPARRRLRLRRRG